MTARRIALSLGAVAIVAASALPGRALADGPPSPSSSVSDPAGDNVPQADPRGDLTSASIAYPSGQGLVVEASVRQFEDPNTHDWKDLGSELTWLFDVDGDGRADYVARYFNAHGQPGAQMFTAGHPSVRCYGSEYADASSGTYGAAFRPECIRTPKGVTYWARLVYRTDSGSSTDETAHGGPVDNPNGVGPNPRPAFTPGDVAEFPAKVPVALTTTPDDAIWYGSAGNPTGAATFTGNPALIRVAQDGTSSDYALPTDTFGAISAIAGANDGTVWFARSGGACYGNACSDTKPAVTRRP